MNDLADQSIIPEAGACVSIVVVREESGSKVVYTANAGDSSIYILNKEKEDSDKLSYDHHTRDDAEVKRLEDMGTEFYCMGDDELRVEGMINVTRTIGDYQLKPYGVTYEPHVTRTVVTENHPFIVVASDGLWDKLKSSKVYEIVTEADNTGEAAKQLLEKSLKERT